jgi:predicted ArsR family transcriptional regulator
MAVGKESQES